MPDFIIKFRWFIIVGFVLMSISLGLFIPNAETDPNLENFIPEDITSRVNTTKLEEIFGGNDMILLLFEKEDILNRESLLRIKKIAKKLKRTDGVEKVISLFDTKDIRGEDGMMLVDPAIKRIPKENDSLKYEKLRDRLINNPLAYEVVISKDFTLAAIIATLEPSTTDPVITALVDSILLDYPGVEKVHKGGQPYMREEIKHDVNRDAAYLIPSALVLMLIMLYFSFHQLRGVLLPFTVVVLSIMFSMGFIPLLGWKYTILTLLLPIMLIAIANDYGIHLMAHYQEINTPGKRKLSGDLAKKVFQALSKPIFLTGLTTIAGILCLLSHSLIPAKQLGILAGIGIAYALILSLLFIPAMIAVLPTAKPIKSIRKGNRSWIDKTLFATAKKVAKLPGRIIIVFIAMIVLCAIGTIFLEVDSNMENFFPRKHPFKISSELINKNFGGSQNLSVLVEGDMKDPELLKRLANYETELEKIEGVGDVMSLATIILEMSKALNDKGDSLYNVIPSSRNAVAQYIELYNMSGDPEDFEQFVDFDYLKGQLLIRVDDGSSRSIKNVSKIFDELSKDDENIRYKGGFAYINQDLAEAVIEGQVSSLIFAVIIIALLLMIIFRSFTAGLIGSLPLATAIIFMFGLMGYFQLKIDIASALLSSIMIGVGVDYTIHFLWRYKEERQKGLNYERAVIKTLISSGKGISFNAFSVIVGFLILFISAFQPIRFFGFLIVVSIFACLVGALVLVPSLILVWKPKFLEPKS